MIMRLPSLVLISIGLVLVSVDSGSDAILDWFKKGESAEPKPAADSTVVATASRADVKSKEVAGGRPPVRPRKTNLSAIRAAKNEQAQLAAGLADPNAAPTAGATSTKPKQAPKQGDAPKKKKTRIPRPPSRQQSLVQDGLDSDDNLDEQIANAMADPNDDLADFNAKAKSAMVDNPYPRPSKKKPEAKYVPVNVVAEDKEARKKLMASINYNPVLSKSKKELKRERERQERREKEKLKPSIGSTKFWAKKFGAAKKAASKVGEYTTEKFGDLQKGVGASAQYLNSKLEINSKGKIAAIIQEVVKSAQFVRREFSKFTVHWSPIMEQALDYLGDTDLDKLTWNDNDEYDLRKDALHSLAFGFEYMRLMIIWRESLLVAHEGFKFWLENLMEQDKDGKLDLEEDLEFTPEEVQNYILLMTWDSFEEISLGPRLCLEHLVSKPIPKDFRSKFYRNFKLLTEFYYPAVEEMTNERNEIRMVGEDQVNTRDFFAEFRDMVDSKKIRDVDVIVPEELSNFMDKLKPQLLGSRLVYSPSFMKSLGEQLAAAAARREKLLETNEPETFVERNVVAAAEETNGADDEDEVDESHLEVDDDDDDDIDDDDDDDDEDDDDKNRGKQTVNKIEK